MPSARGRRYSDASRLYEFAGRWQIVLPLVERRYLPGVTATAASFPIGWGVGGVITPANLQRHHLKAVIADLKGLPYLRLNVRPNPRRGDLWADVLASENIQQRPRLAHAIDLTGGFDQVFARFSKETRSRIRKAEKFGIEVKCSSNGDLVHVVYDLLEKSVVRWAKKQNEPKALARWRFHQRDPIEKIQASAKSLGKHCRVWVASIDGRPVASLLVLLGKNANDSRSAIDREALGTSGGQRFDPEISDRRRLPAWLPPLSSGGIQRFKFSCTLQGTVWGRSLSLCRILLREASFHSCRQCSAELRRKGEQVQGLTRGLPRQQIKLPNTPPNTRLSTIANRKSRPAASRYQALA